MIFGICGKIASGKSEVLKILKKNGFHCIYADKIVHDSYKSGGVGCKKIAAVFGVKFLNKKGEVDREKLRDEVFNDENKLRLLNDIIHPVVYVEIADILSKMKPSENVAIEAVYFDEDFLSDFVDRLLWVERPMDQMIEVLVVKRGFSMELAEKAIDYVHKPNEIDFTLKNIAALTSLESGVTKILSLSKCIAKRQQNGHGQNTRDCSKLH